MCLFCPYQHVCIFPLLYIGGREVYYQRCWFIFKTYVSAVCSPHFVKTQVSTWKKGYFDFHENSKNISPLDTCYEKFHVILYLDVFGLYKSLWLYTCSKEMYTLLSPTCVFYRYTSLIHQILCIRITLLKIWLIMFINQYPVFILIWIRLKQCTCSKVFISWFQKTNYSVHIYITNVCLRYL